MIEPRELSKLPDDPAYWARLESRIEGAVLADLASSAAVPETREWYAPLVARAWWLTGLAAAAAVLVMLVPRQTPSPGQFPMLITASAETALSPLMTREAPPAVAELLISAAQSTAR
jgi:hypothetical protein